MGRPRDDFDLLLKAPHPVEAEVARGMLAEAGIPTLVHGADFDLAELGAAHALLRRADVYVPRGERSRARAVLSEAGFAEPLAVEPGEDVERAGTRAWQRWTLLLVWLGIPLIGVLLLHLLKH